MHPGRVRLLASIMSAIVHQGRVRLLASIMRVIVHPGRVRFMQLNMVSRFVQVWGVGFKELFIIGAEKDTKKPQLITKMKPRKNTSGRDELCMVEVTHK